jgi:hypothetical protein
VRRWSAVSAMLVSLLVLPTVVRESVVIPTSSVPRRSSSNLLASLAGRDLFLFYFFVYF